MADSSIPAGQISRRRFALAVPMLGSLGLLATPSVWANAAHAHAATPLQRASRVLMGTQVDMVVHGASSSAPALQAAMERAFAHMQTLEAMMSRFRSDSVLQQINAQAGKAAVTVAPEMMAVLGQARSVWHASNGAFDPTVGALAAWRFEPGVQAMPSTAQISQALQHIGADKLQLSASNNTARLTQSGMALDLGGIAKLPILAAGLAALQAQGVENALINGGGDVVTMGLNQGKAWRIGIRDPRQPSQLLGAVAIEGQGVVASSGDYERCFERDGQRYHHVLNPRTGWPTTQVHGVALVARDVAAVNGWGTALMVQGPAAAPAWSQRHPEVALLLADRDGQVWQNASMAQQLQTA